MTPTPEHILISTLAKERTAGLRGLLDSCEDKELARKICRDLLQLLKDANTKHSFGFVLMNPNKHRENAG